MAKVKNHYFSKINKDNPLVYTKRKSSDNYTHNARFRKLCSKCKKK